MGGCLGNSVWAGAALESVGWGGAPVQVWWTGQECAARWGLSRLPRQLHMQSSNALPAPLAIQFRHSPSACSACSLLHQR